MKLPMSDSRIQRVGWMVIVLGAGAAAGALVACMLSYGDYTWRASSVASLFETTILNTFFPTPGYREWWQTLGHGALEVLAVGIAVIILGNPIKRLFHSLFAWISHGA